MAGRTAEIRQVRDTIGQRADEMGRCKSRYDLEVNALNASYDPRTQQLRAQLYATAHATRYLQRELEWKKKVIETRRARGAQFDEASDLRVARSEALAEAREMFRDAIVALDALRPADLAVLRRYSAPPPLVWLALEAVLKLGGEWQPTWDDAQVILTDNYFFGFYVPRARQFDLDGGITDEVLADLEPNMRNPDFLTEIVARASVPCAALCKFARSVYEYGRVSRIVAVSGLGDQALAGDIEALQAEMRRLREGDAETERRLERLKADHVAAKCDLRGRYEPELKELQEQFKDAHQRFSALVAM